MTKRSERFIYVIAVLLMVGGIALWLTTAFRENMVYFVTPSEFMAYSENHPTRMGKRFRLGGRVKEGSLQREGLMVRFVVTDEVHHISVHYEGITPELFREKQGVIAEGVIHQPSSTALLFKADRLLAKHDERYKPPSKKHLLLALVFLGFSPIHIQAVLPLFSLFLPYFPHIFSHNIPVPVQHNHYHI